MVYFQGASSRDTSLTPLQAPAACFWAAIRIAKARKIRVFDFGGHTPGLPPSDSRHGVYEFKKKWGGVESQFYNAEIIISPYRYRLQETVGKVLWRVLHPTYFRIQSWLRDRPTS
jgi:lipid II:glycine glycyltransferase (peptidoglycan interpeptide bridge formation enzyme)